MSALDVYAGVKRVQLNSGEVLMTEQQLLVTTILGSCIAVCMFDPVTGRAGICHGALPNAPLSFQGQPFRYCDEAILYLLERFRRTGTPLPRLCVKVFGGADVLGSQQAVGYALVGTQNAVATIETLGWQKVRPAVVETGGNLGRKLVFVTHTGETFVKRIDRSRS